MKRKALFFCLCLFAVCSLTLSSCIKENGYKTIALIGDEYYIKEKDLLTLIPDTMRVKFLKKFGGITEGYVPPNIEGSYVMDSKRLDTTNAAFLPSNNNNVWLRFSKQHNGIAKLELNEISKTEIDTVYIYGQGNRFTAYCIENLSIDTFNLKMRRLILMKGTVAQGGLSDFRYATIILGLDTNTPDLFDKVGTYYIYKEGDGLVKNETW